MKLDPIQDRIIVRRIGTTGMSAGGIALPASATENPNQGEVLAVGPGKRAINGAYMTPSIEAGDRVLFKQHTLAQTVEVDGEELLVMTEDDVLAVIRG